MWWLIGGYVVAHSWIFSASLMEIGGSLMKIGVSLMEIGCSLMQIGG